MKRKNRWMEKLKKVYSRKSLQFMIAISFTLVTTVAMAFLGLFLYQSYNGAAENIIMEDNSQLVDQVDRNLSNYLRNMMRISDALYYNVIKNIDMGQDTMETEMNLLYESNKDNLISLACFTTDGELVGAAPLVNLKDDLNVTEQDWFVRAMDKMENLHFSSTHVQNLFANNNNRYYWVLSLSRGVELTKNGRVDSGILLVDMDFSGIKQLFSKVNTQDMGYVYLIGNDGSIIYHPRQNLIFSHLLGENNLKAATYEDGIHREDFKGQERMVVVKTVGYTGWKIVSVTPVENLRSQLSRTRAIGILIMLLAIILMIFVNQVVSTRIVQPLKRLEDSVKDVGDLGSIEASQIYIGGSHEIQHLGKTIQSMVEKLRQLTDDVVREQEEKRKSELDALQSQINPHFLYNTLDSIMWMVEAEQYEDAISMVNALANLFRISLSKGKNIITVGEELSHAQNYLAIQKYRYKNKFDVFFEIEEGIEPYKTIKLIVQPLVENAIYYGMEAMYGDGEIRIRAYTREEDLYIEVEDNGLGMPKEVVDGLLTDGSRTRSRGSGIGLRNVHQRIQLYFGASYGLEIESEPDEGTTVRIHLPKLCQVDQEPKEGVDEKI
ncbi:MAG: sensor histidine kinase [Blautia sp.]|jgi:two-component system sensor histidine kinase YesM